MSGFTPIIDSSTETDIILKRLNEIVEEQTQYQQKTVVQLQLIAAILEEAFNTGLTMEDIQQ